MQDLSLGDQFLDRAGNVFHRHIRVDTVLIEQVDAVGPEAFERAFHRRADALRRAVHSAAAVDVEAEFRCDNDTVADGLQSLADNFLVLVRAIDFGCIEERDAAFECAADQGDGVGQG